ncbi:uncharacterized protein ACIBXB_008810 [Morphnus guianensis]
MPLPAEFSHPSARRGPAAGRRYQRNTQPLSHHNRKTPEANSRYRQTPARTAARHGPRTRRSTGFEAGKFTRRCLRPHPGAHRVERGGEAGPRPRGSAGGLPERGVPPRPPASPRRLPAARARGARTGGGQRPGPVPPARGTGGGPASVERAGARAGRSGPRPRSRPARTGVGGCLCGCSTLGSVSRWWGKPSEQTEGTTTMGLALRPDPLHSSSHQRQPDPTVPGQIHPCVPTTAA